MGVSRLSKDQVSTIASGLDDNIEELCARPLDGLPVPYVWLDATYVKFRRKGRVASTAVVTAIGCDAGGRGCVLGFDVVDTESYGSWLAFLRKTRDCGAGVEIVLDANLASSERSARPSKAPHGSTAPSTSCAAACARRALRRGSHARDRWAGRLGADGGGGQEDNRIRPRTWGQDRGDIGYQPYSRFQDAGPTRLGSSSTPNFPLTSSDSSNKYQLIHINEYHLYCKSI